MASVAARGATRSRACGVLPRTARASRVAHPRHAVVAHGRVVRPRRGERASFFFPRKDRNPRGSAPRGPLDPTPTRGDAAVARALIAPEDSLELYTALLTCASLGAYADKTAVGRALSGPVCAMVFGALFANAGVLPAPGPHYAAVQTATVSLATPLLLFGADLRAVLKATGSLSVAFLVGSFAVALASFAAFYGVSDPMHSVGVASNGDGWKLAAALVAKNVGGGMNYVAVCDTLGVSPVAFSAGIAADNVFAILYFPLASFLGGEPETRKSIRAEASALDERGGAATRDAPERETHDAYVSSSKSGASGWRGDDSIATPNSKNENENASDWRDRDAAVSAAANGTTSSEKKKSRQREPSTSTAPESIVASEKFTVGSLILATAVSCFVLSCATRIAPVGLGVLPTATAITVLLATATPPAVSRFLKPSGDALGSCLLFVFFATAGAAGGALERAFAHPALFAYLFALYAVHALGVFLVGKKLLKFTTKELLVASNANVGGPATAGALAAGKNWTDLVVPGMLVGNLGNAIGTFVGLGMAKAFYHLCW